MCNLTRKANIARCNGRHTTELYPRQTRTIPYDTVKQNHCAWTGEHLGPDYVLKTGQTPKAFSEKVYQWIIGNPRSTCFLCTENLGPKQQAAQCSQPREIVNHMCAECKEYMGLIYRKVAGMDNSFLADEQKAIPHQQHFIDPQNPGVIIDAEYEEIKPQRIPHQPVRQITHQPIRALPHQPMQTIDDMFKNTRTHNQHRETVPAHIRRMH